MTSSKLTIYLAVTVFILVVLEEHQSYGMDIDTKRSLRASADTTNDNASVPTTVQPSQGTEYPDLDQRKKNSGHGTQFNTKWQDGRPWLQCVKEMSPDGHKFEAMYCSVCSKWSLKNRGPWVSTGCTSMRHDIIVRHEDSEQHKNSISQELTASASIDKLARNIDSREKKALIDAQKVLHFLIQHNLPHTTLFKPLVELCVALGAENLPHLSKGKNAQYTSPKIIDEFLTCQAETVEEEVKEKIKTSDAYGVMIDEYTDVSARKHLAVVGKYVYNGESNLSFLQDIQLPNGSADIIYQSLKNYLHDASISLDSMTSFASDGPSVMTGKNGVVAKLKQDNPRVIPVHCLNHRLQLAVSKAFGSVREIDSVDEILIAIWKYYHFSTVKSGSLDDLLFEWNDIKEKFSGVLDKCIPKFMLAKLFETKETTGSIFPLMTRLLSVHESLILSTAPVERVFSQVKLIVTDHRNRLEVETTNKLLMIKLNTKSASDIDMDKVIKKFLAKNRRLM